MSSYSGAPLTGQGIGTQRHKAAPILVCPMPDDRPMLWLKSLHIIFVVTWFAGLFYLPRLFVYHVEADEAVVRDRFAIMERRLLGITHIGGALAIVFGLATLGWWQHHVPGYFAGAHWLHIKLALVALLVVYHSALVVLARQLAEGRCRRSSRWLRVFNEAPALLLIAIVLLAVVKPG